MIFSSLSKRERTIFALTGIVLGASLFYAVVLESFVKRWTVLDSRIAVREIKLKKEIRLLDRYESLKDRYRQYASFAKGVKSDEQLMAGILAEIEGLARRSNVYITAMKPRAIKDADFYQKFIVEAELDTAVADLMKFFYELQESDNLLRVEGMEINAKSNQKDSVKGYVLISRLLLKNE